MDIFLLESGNVVGGCHAVSPGETWRSADGPAKARILSLIIQFSHPFCENKDKRKKKVSHMFVARRHICKMPQQPSYQDDKKAATSSQSFIPSFTYLHLFGHSYSSTSKAKYRTKSRAFVLYMPCKQSRTFRSVGTLTGRGIVKGRRRSTVTAPLRVAPRVVPTHFFGADQIEIESPVGLPAYGPIQQPLSANQENGVRASWVRYWSVQTTGNLRSLSFSLWLKRERVSCPRLRGPKSKKRNSSKLLSMLKKNLLLVALVCGFATRSRCENIVTRWRLLKAAKYNRS
jgi:hypothetical protein